MYLWEKLGLKVVFQEPSPCFLCSAPIPSHPIRCCERKENFRVYIWLKGCPTLASTPGRERKGKEGMREGGRRWGISRMGEGGACGNFLGNISVKSDLEAGRKRGQTR